ncbi:MAG: IS1634 family transposase [Verrucomicrobia bacterium]|nr:IS1634 family transposase [Verrucomicrobiota bacterium]
MASLQQKTSRGHKYWYIVESRRVNGKPRPVVLAYLGKAEDLLRRLAGIGSGAGIKSYAHGAVAALLRVAQELEVPSIINQHVHSTRTYTPDKPLRNDLTVGATLLLGAIGRACLPTSKQAWWEWAKTTSCEYLLRVALNGMDSQHFWDLMDALPVEAIEKIEQQLLERVRQRYGLSTDTLLYDTTNFFTFIATTNTRCTLAQRAKNKQKRHDLRQVGLALVVTREDQIPLFHLTYQGNRHDGPVFSGIVESLKQRMLALGLDLEKHTLVFDRGNNSKKNMALIAEAGLHYVGALTPYHHPALLDHAEGHFTPVQVQEQTLGVFRTQDVLWDRERTLLVFVSNRLKTGQLRGLYVALKKAEDGLAHLQKTINAPSQRSQKRKDIEARIATLLNHQFIKDLVDWSLDEAQPGPWQLTFAVNHERLAELEKTLGFRILMTDRHDWQTANIIEAFHGQADVEHAFKNIKNPYHLALRPQFHWTDQKIAVHYFMCVLGYLMTTLLWREAKAKAQFKGSVDTLLDTLNSIRLAATIDASGKPGRHKVTYQLEQLDESQRKLAQALGILDAHTNRPQLQGVGVYISKRT